MLARADSSANQRLRPLARAALPAWARVENPAQSAAEAAFFAGAALARLDALVREEPPYAGVWRRRLALSAAVASVARTARSESEAGLRDALHLTKPGANPGPAGRHLLAWRALTTASAGQWRSAVIVAAAALLVPEDERLQQAIAAAATCASGAEAAPFAAARAFGLATQAFGAGPKAGRWGGAGEPLTNWLADAVLAQKLKWPFAVPLLAGSLVSADRRRADEESAEGAAVPRILAAYAKAAAQACDLSAELGRRAQRLHEAAPKLRAKGAGAALAALLDEDCLSAATRIPGLSERGARRLFERLVSLGAIRELTGRATFRLYGL